MSTVLEAPAKTTEQGAQIEHPEGLSESGVMAEFVAWLTPDIVATARAEDAAMLAELERLAAENRLLAEALEQRIPAGQVVLGPRCKNVGQMTGSVCGAFLAVAVGAGTILDCPRCRMRHEW